MFETLVHAKKALDEGALCAQGICTSSPQNFSGKTLVESAPHIATDGLYTPEIIKEYRKCSNDYATVFSIDKKFHGSPPEQAKYDDTADGKIEQFRMCWESIDLSENYDVSPVFK
jgi:hypothetical protein